MRRGRWLIPSICAICLGGWSLAAAADSNAGTAKCPPQFAACFTRAELEQIDLKLRAYERDTRRFFPSCTVGPGLAGVVDTDLHWRVVPAPIGINCGLTIRLGRLWSHR